jgi:hypothetical protein
MVGSSEDSKAMTLTGYFASYAAELMEVNKSLAAELAAAQKLIVELVRELGPSAIVHPNPIVRKLALEAKEEVT